MGQINRKGVVVFTDAGITLREDGPKMGTSYEDRKPWEKEFRDQVFKRVIQQMNRLGFNLKISEEDKKHYQIIARDFREGKKGDLYCEVSLRTRMVEIKFWQSVNTPTRPDHNGKYESNKEEIMPYVIRLKMEHARRRLRSYFCGIFSEYEFETERSDGRQNKRGPGKLTAHEWVQGCYETSWHFKGDLSNYEISDYNRKSADGQKLEHGQRVWFYDRKGRCSTGIAMYNINNMWWVITGKYDVTNEACFGLYAQCPENPRAKNNTRLRRGRLENQLSTAIKKMDFERAALLKRLIFGDQVLYHLISKSDGLYWRPNYSGYTNDSNDAGKYTDEEVEFYRNQENVKVVPIYAN